MHLSAKYSRIITNSSVKGVCEMRDFSVGLFNDSFPPMIDGVAQVVKNYATFLNEKNCQVTVVTPDYKGVQDNYPFDVYRYPSLPATARIGYRVGVPFTPETITKLHSKKFDIMHIHSPFASSVLVNTINHRPRVPVVLTYHTRFDLDIQKRIPTAAMRKVASKFMLKNVKSADEIWVVTSACGKFLRDIGYEGPYRVMENGTDFVRGAASAEKIAALREQYQLYEDVPVFLFVGRMMWYKNIRIILDTLAILRDNGMDFRAFFVGDGYDLPDIKSYATDIGLQDHTVFTGPLFDREQLRVFYSITDLFLFPSTYDTCGIVVKEAAACNCPSLLVENSGASEGAVHGENAFLAQENAASCAQVVMQALSDRDNLKTVGINAGKTLYLSWSDVVDRAYARYEEILNR